jgi:hypothetical protein
MLCHYNEFRILFVVMLNVNMLGVVMLIVVMLSVIMLRVIAPFHYFDTMTFSKNFFVAVNNSVVLS